MAVLENPGPSRLAPGAARVIEQLAPVKMRVHPLTRIERTPSEGVRIICHLELLDQFGHSVKWLGASRVELYRPGGGGADMNLSGTDRQELVWQRDLNDARANADAYDWVTRTYLLVLGDAPAWVGGIDDASANEPWLTLKAYFSYSGVDGQEKHLSASFRIDRRGR